MRGSTKSITLISIIFGLVSIGIAIFILYPLFKEIQQNSNEFVSARNDLKTLEDKAESFEKAKELYDTFESDLKKIDKIFLDPEIPLDFISFLEKTAQSSETQINVSPTISSNSKEHPWDYMGFQIFLADSFPNAMKFLQKIENSPYLIEIQNITAKRLSEQELKSDKYKKLPLGAVGINLSLKVYTTK